MKALAHVGNDQKSSPFELFVRPVYSVEIFQTFKTQKGKQIIGQKLPNIMAFQMAPLTLKSEKFWKNLVYSGVYFTKNFRLDFTNKNSWNWVCSSKRERESLIWLMQLATWVVGIAL